MCVATFAIFYPPRNGKVGRCVALILAISAILRGWTEGLRLSAAFPICAV